MGKPTGFLDYHRQDPAKRPIEERLTHYREFEQLLPEPALRQQGARCMDCGVPHCHTYGCPVQNRIPDWNDAVYHGRWELALELLHATNNFPEITGRVCPAPCEAACTLAINQPAVSIKQLELAIIERGFEQGLVLPEPPQHRTGKRVAVVGSGPAGLAAAQQLRRAGHDVVLYERADRIGGLLRYGIPDFKLEKSVLDRRIEQMRAEGVVFETQVAVGKDISASYLRRSFDATLLCIGARVPRDVEVPGRDLPGIHFAMDFLTQNNCRVAGDYIPEEEVISAKGKHVVVIGGGDTGADCVGTANRQGALSVTNFELLDKPPGSRPADNPWPTWPRVLRTSSSHEEGCERDWAILTKEFVGSSSGVTAIRAVRVRWESGSDGRMLMREIPGSEYEIPAELVLIAAGFIHPEQGVLAHELGWGIDGRGNLLTDQSFMTSTPGVFAAGDCVRGASLVVHAIFQGRQAAAGVTRWLR